MISKIKKHGRRLLIGFVGLVVIVGVVTLISAAMLITTTLILSPFFIAAHYFGNMGYFWISVIYIGLGLSYCIGETAVNFFDGCEKIRQKEEAERKLQRKLQGKGWREKMLIREGADL